MQNGLRGVGGLGWTQVPVGNTRTVTMRKPRCWESLHPSFLWTLHPSVIHLLRPAHLLAYGATKRPGTAGSRSCLASEAHTG